MLVTVCSGRSFATMYAKETPSSSCFVSLLLSEYDWENTILKPKSHFNETQTDESLGENNHESIVDEFVNISGMSFNSFLQL